MMNNSKEARVRNGKGYSLALNAGPQGMHITLVYFNCCRRGYEQETVKNMAYAYLQELGETHVDITLGAPCYSRSVEVHSEMLERIRDELRELFSSFDISAEPQHLHVDLRSRGEGAVWLRVPLLDNWYI